MKSSDQGNNHSYDEHDVIARGLGKWSDPDVPKSGWSSVYVYDLGKGIYRICEMCETVHIRFVHVMEHKIGLRLESGCICAGHMEDNLAAARARDDDIQKAASRVARRARALVKAQTALQAIHFEYDDPLPILNSVIPTLERLRKVAARRNEGATSDSKLYDGYYAASVAHSAFLQAVETALLAARARLNLVLSRQRARELQQSIDRPTWWPTPKGFRFTTVHGDKAQVFKKGDRYAAMYELANGAPVWSTLRFPSAQAAQERVRLVLASALRKAKRLPPMASRAVEKD